MHDDFDRLVAQAEEPELKPDTKTLEGTLMAALFASPETAERVLAETRPADFYYDFHRRLAEVVYPDLSEGRHVDAVTLAAALPEPADEAARADRDTLLAYAREVMDRAKADPPGLGKVEAYLSIFTETARRQLAKVLVKKAGEALDKGDTSPAEAASRVFQVMTDLEASRRLVGAFRAEADDWPAYMAALTAQQQGGREFIGLDTGYEHLNNVINGLTPGLIVLGAAPSTGKTTFAKQLVDQVAELNESAACLFVSLEQSREELRVKTLSRLAGIENRDILRGRLEPSLDGWKRVEHAAEEHRRTAAGRIFILEGDKATTPDRIRLAALQVKRATQAEHVFIVIDYLQIVPTEAVHRDPRSRVDDVVSDLRRMARDLKAPVLAISSVGRVQYGKPSLSAFKESGGIEYTGDIAAVMSRPKEKTKGRDQYGGLCPEWPKIHRAWKVVNLDIVKNRNGERARLTFKFWPEVSLFTACDKEDLPDEDPGQADDE